MNPPEGNPKTSSDHTSPSPAPTDGWGSRRQIHSLLLMGVTLGGVYLCYRMTVPFLSALTWAITLAVMFISLQRWLENRIKKPSLAALISVLLIAMIVVVPLFLLGQRLVKEAAKGSELIKDKVESGEWRTVLNKHPRLVPVVRWIEEEADLPGTVKSGAAWLTGTAGNLVKGSLVQLMGLLLTFYLLFFMLRDREDALDSLRTLSPLSKSEMDLLINRVDDTIFATVYGTLAVSLVQGILGGLMFWWLGLQAPLLWGTVMALFALLPVLGAFMVWIPAAIFLLAAGSWEKALILTVWGAVVIGTADNLLRPMLVGKRLKLHTILAFFSVIGGLMLFGAAGFVLGPIILTVTIVFLEIWRARVPGLPKAAVGGMTTK